MTDPNMLSINNMRGQTERVQHNVKALLYLRAVRDALKTPEKGEPYRTSIKFRLERGEGTEEGKAAAPLIAHVIQEMLPEIIQRTIQYAENGNKEALAAIGQLAETLKES